MTNEVNLDGIVGPTHNYSGLSYGNIPSAQHQYSSSNPKEAALQGLEKMKFLADLGLVQGVLPPQERPHLPTLKALGFSGTDSGIITAVFAQAPELLYAVSSAASMWAANAATVCPSMDSIDQHVHFTAANLSSKFHRSIEYKTTERVLKAIFKNPIYFKHHQTLPPTHFSDEGAANHSRFSGQYGMTGVQLFVYGKRTFTENSLGPKVFPARQSYEASLAISRLHQLYPDRVVFAQQHPAAIDAGAFHNDVVAIGNLNFFLFHELAFIGKEAIIEEIKLKVAKSCDTEMIFCEVKNEQIPLQDAINSYLFNSQIVDVPETGMCLIAPLECQENERIRKYIENMLQSKENPIRQVHYFNLRQSMHNGGGPACLRLRVVLNENELSAAHPHVFLNDLLYRKLTDWVKKHYRDRLVPKDLADPHLLLESQHALDDLTKILQIGQIYDFQSPLK